MFLNSSGLCPPSNFEVPPHCQVLVTAAPHHRYQTLYPCPIVTVTNHHTQVYSYSPTGHESQTGLAGPKAGCRQSRLPAGAPGRSPFHAFSGFWRPPTSFPHLRSQPCGNSPILIPSCHSRGRVSNFKDSRDQLITSAHSRITSSSQRASLYHICEVSFAT